jgi:hypothetical protein
MSQSVGKSRAAKDSTTATASKTWVAAIPIGLEKRLISMVPEAKAAKKLIRPVRRPNFEFRQALSNGTP